MFYRLRIPSGLKATSAKPGEEPPERRLFKNKQCEKNGSSWASALVACRQGHREGGLGRQWPRGLWSLGGPLEGPIDFRGLMEMTLTNQFVEHRRSFFSEITSKSGEYCGIFLFFFGVYKPEMPNIWADPEPTFGSRRPCKQLTSTCIAFVVNNKLHPQKYINYRCSQPLKIFRSQLRYGIWAYYYLEIRLDSKM